MLLMTLETEVQIFNHCGTLSTITIRGGTVHVFALHRIGTGVTVRCMNLHGENTV